MRRATRSGTTMGAEPLKVLESRRREAKSLRSRWRRALGRRVRRGALFVGFLLFSAALFPRDSGFEITTLREGFPAKRDLIAPFQFFLLKDRDQLRQEQVMAARRVPPVYSADPAVATRARAFLDSLQSADLRAVARGRSSAFGRLRSRGLSSEAVRVLAGPDGRRVLMLAESIAE